MDKKQKIVLFSGIGVVVILIALLLCLILSGNDTTDSAPVDDTMQAQLDSLRAENDALQISRLEASLDSLPTISEQQSVNLKADQQEILDKYNDAKSRIQSLLSELKAEKAKSAKERKNNKEYQAKIAELEGQIAQLKDYCKELLTRLADLNVKYEEEVQKNTVLTEQNRALTENVSATTARNEELSTKVAQAQRLVLTGVSLHAYNKKDKAEKNVTKARKLSVSFTITANNAARPGLRDFFIIIKTPEGQNLTGGGSFTADGASLHATARRQVEYGGEEVPVTIYYDVNTSLTPGTYTVSIFADGTRLATNRPFTLK